MMATKNQWVRCNKGRPCPICDHTSWCSVSADGKIVDCRRVEDGAWKVKPDASGAPHYFHRLDGQVVRRSTQLPQIEDVERAKPEVLHRVYSAMLASFPLNGTHRKNLLARGLPDTEITLRAYGSLPARGRSVVATALEKRFGQMVISVPGFIVKLEPEPYLTIAGGVGLMIPVRNVAGNIVAIKIRQDEGESGDRYRSMSSHHRGGAGPGAPCHVPGWIGKSEKVRLTEGELKADVATVLSGLPTISVPGAGNWRTALPVIKHFGWRYVQLAFDGDALTNLHVATALCDCAEELRHLGIAVAFERWAVEHKGVDDALVAGIKTEVLVGDDGRAALKLVRWMAGESEKRKNRKD